MTDGKITIEWGAVPNARTCQDGKPMGWLPQVWVNGRATLNEFAAYGCDADAARVHARHEATEERDRYVGDWELALVER